MIDRDRTGSSFLALACIGFITSAPAAAQTAEKAPDGEKRLGGMTVNATAIDEATLKVERPASPKYTRPLLDTPQTITVISSASIQQQNLLSLNDVLSTVPGITFGAGEGGGGYGDSINLRGFSASSDITMDGVRDSAQYTRSDTFNVEQVEVANGANSVYNGSGSVGGTINLVTKTPRADDFVNIGGGIGTDEYYRATVDANKRLSDKIAVRLNAMWHRNEVPDRDVERSRRWGVAPSITIGIDGPTSLTFAYFHQEDNNIPLYGVPYYAVAGGLPDGISRSAYFGYRNVDRQRINTDVATGIFRHEFSDKVSIRNLTRYSNTKQFSLVDPPQGSYCLANGLLPTGAACPAGQPAGTYQPSGPRGNTRDSSNDLWYSQTDLTAVADTGGIEHTIVLGGSWMQEDFRLGSGSSLRNPDGSTVTLPLMQLSSPDSFYTGPVNFIRTQIQNGHLTNYAAYLFDTIKLSEQFEINGGIRYEKNKGYNRNDTVALPSAGGGITPGTTFRNSENLFSYRGGLVFKPVPEGTIYVAYGNSKTPSKTSVNGACSAATCNVKPESAVSYEAGVKWNLFDGGLLASAAVFRNERSNYKVPSVDPTIPDQQLDGKSRVNGVALGATGNVTRAWAVQANYTYLDSKVIRNVAKNAPAGTPPTADVTAGNPLTQVPKHSGSVWTTYDLPFGLQLGYGFTYQGSFYLNNGAAPLFKSKSYWMHRAAAIYTVSDAVKVQLNLQNLFDKTYYTRIRNNGWATPSEGFRAILSTTISL